MYIDKSKKVLVIDGDESSKTLINLILEVQGYTVFSVENIKDSWSEIKQFAPNLIILVSAKNQIFSLELLKCLKSKHLLSQIPVLLIAKSSPLHSELLINVDRICYKPFDIEDFVSQIQLLLNCEENIKTPTLIIDIDDSNHPLVKENQQWQSILDRETSPWQKLKQQGYSVFVP